VINSIGHIFASTAGGVFRSMNDADQWSDVGGGLLPPGGNVWAVDLGHDDDCFLPAGKHSRGATLALLFTHSRCPDTGAPKAPEA
jgi:hypothetical protein